MATFLDTNVIAYAFDRSAGDKRDRALAILADDAEELVVSPQVMAEFYVTATRTFAEPLPASVAHDVVRELARLTVAPLDADTTLTAITVAQEHRIAFWDAQIVVAAARSGCDTLLSENLNHGQRILDVEVVNPFLDGA